MSQRPHGPIRAVASVLRGTPCPLYGMFVAKGWRNGFQEGLEDPDESPPQQRRRVRREVEFPLDRERPLQERRRVDCGRCSSRARRRDGATRRLDDLEREQGGRVRQSRTDARAWSDGRRGRRARHREHADREHRVGQGRRRSAQPRDEPGQRPARPRSRRLERSDADDQSGRAHRRQPEFAQGRAPRTGVARGLHSSRKDHALRSRANPRADCPRSGLGRARLLRVLPADDQIHPRLNLRRSRQAHPRVRAVLDRRRRAWIGGYSTRRARLRRQVLHGRGQLGSRRQQYSGLLHPGRDEIPGPHSRGQAGAARRDSAGGDGARYVLGLRLADAGVDAHAHVGHVGSRAPAQPAHDAGVRGSTRSASSMRAARRSS